MSFLHLVPALLMLLAQSHAQSTGLVSLTLAMPSKTADCGSNNAALTLSVFEVRRDGCFNVNTTFANPAIKTDNLATASSVGTQACTGIENCGISYRISSQGTPEFDMYGNYSHVTLSQAQPSEGEKGRYTVNVYGAEDCSELDPEISWFQFSCADSPCNELPHGVRSFRIASQTDTDGSCVVAAERGLGGKGRTTSLMAVAIAVVGGALIL